MIKYLFIIVILFGLVLPVQAAIYYIDYSGGADTNNGTSTSTPFKHCPGDNNATDTAASTTFSAGDRIIFKGGVTYSVPASSQISLSWGGSGDAEANRIIYDGDSGTYVSRWGSGISKAKIDGGGVASNIFLVVTNKSYITLNSFELTNTSTSSDNQPIINGYVTGVNYITISNSYLHDPGAGCDICIEFKGNNWVIDGNTFTNCQGIAIYGLNSPSNTDIKNNTISGSVSWGVCLAETGTGIQDGNSIHHNTIHDITSACHHVDPIMMFVQGGAGSFTNTDIHGNYFYDTTPISATGTITLQLNTAGASMSGMKVYNNIAAGQGVNDFMEFSANGNTMTNIYIYGNSVWSNVDNKGGFFYLQNGGTAATFNGIYIKNNSYKGKYPPIRLGSSLSIFSNVAIDYNVWNSSWTRNDYKGTIYGSWASWRTAESGAFDANSYGFGIDPLYTNTTTAPYNLMPQPSSLLINHGDTLTATYNTDYLGTPRPQGSAWDIGAYEYPQVGAATHSSLTITNGGVIH